MNNEYKLKKINDWIGTMSYFNAAEGSWTSEATQRREFKDAVAEEVKKWDITEDQFKDLYDQCSRQLTTVSDFLHDVRSRKGFKE